MWPESKLSNYKKKTCSYKLAWLMCMLRSLSDSGASSSLAVSASLSAVSSTKLAEHHYGCEELADINSLGWRVGCVRCLTVARRHLSLVVSVSAVVSSTSWRSIATVVRSSLRCISSLTASHPTWQTPASWRPNLLCQWRSCPCQKKNRYVQCDHLSGKPGNVREFETCQRNVRDVVNSQGNVREKILSW